MEKQNEINQLTRECLLTALLRLMETKPYDSITITDITRLAGVSRMAYYRNYRSKDDILTDGLVNYERALLDSLAEDRAESLRDVVIYIAGFFRDHAALIRAVYAANLSHSLFTLLCERAYMYFPVVKNLRDGQYRVYYYAGAVLSVLRCWLEAGMRESAEEIASIIYEIINREKAVEYLVVPESRGG
ncbi:MAG: TetR/AcrR family transcriptional regulator [Clostridia bacterium]|nr:TetR/AcrR family transcriptional regulator [Clostridia bacterium]